MQAASHADFDHERDLFARALQLPESDRDAFVQRECLGRADLLLAVRGLLSHAPGKGGSSTSEPDASITPPPSRRIGLQIGKYKTLDLIGEGSFGSVFEAAQEQPRRSVALKLIRRSSDISARRWSELLRRFELEQNILGRLQHPGIAQIYESGSVDLGDGPQPYFAMELVRGTMLTEYANGMRAARARAAPLAARERLKLLGSIASAVHHAHQRGIIHRDLKPANILVSDDGQAKVLDFGVARLADSDKIPGSSMCTVVGQIVGTIAYMSPEQALGNPDDLDTRSDVYSLGVIAFQLLSGRLPIEPQGSSVPEAMRAIAEQAAPRLGAFDRALRGDVETLVGKALEKEKDRRYPSADAFAADIQRFLTGEPIEALRESALHQLWRLARRHKAVVVATLLVIAALSLGLLREHAQRQRADREAQRARDQAAIAESAVEFLDSLLSKANRGLAGGNPDVTVREVMDTAASELTMSNPASTPPVERRLRRTIASTYMRLGLLLEAEEMLRPAFSLPVEENEDIAPSYHEMAGILHQLGREAEARTYAERALALRIEMNGEDHVDVGTGFSLMGMILNELQDHAGAEWHLRKALEIHLSNPESNPEQRSSDMTNLGCFLRDRGRVDEAETLLRQSLELQRQALGADHPDVADARSNLAVLLSELGQHAEARQMLTDALDASRRIWGEEHPSVATKMDNLACQVEQAGAADEAEALFREALRIRRKVLPPGHPDIAVSLNNLGLLLQGDGRLLEAEALLREALDIQRTVRSPGHPDIATALDSYAHVVFDQERYAEADELYLEAHDIRLRAYGAKHEDVGTSLNNLGNNALHQLDMERAERLLREALQVFLVSPVQPNNGLVTVYSNLGLCLELDDRLIEAETAYREGLRLANALFGAEHHETIGLMQSLGEALFAQDKRKEAESLFRTVLARRSADEPFDLANTTLFLGRCLAATSRYEEALLCFERAQQLCEEHPAALVDLMPDPIDALIALFDDWHAVEPHQGYDAKAEEWQGKLAALQAATQPAWSCP